MTGSLDDFGITYKQVNLLDDGSFDLEKIGEALKNPNTRLVSQQWSKPVVKALVKPLVKPEVTGRIRSAIAALRVPTLLLLLYCL